MNSSRLASLICFVCVWVCGAQLARAAAPEDELKRLRAELREARTEVERLKRENDGLRRQLQSPMPAPVPRPGLAPASPVAETSASPRLPAWEPGQTLALDDLVQHFRTDAVAAQARFAGQTLRVRGVIDRIDPPWVGMTYALSLRGQDALSRAKCETRFPGISDFRLTPDRAALFGSRPFKKEALLARAGEPIELQGHCAGLREGQVVFTNCRPVPVAGGR